MAFTSFTIKSHIVSSVTSFYNFASAGSSNVFNYSSILYTVPSGKIAKVITKQFNRDFALAILSSVNNLSYYLGYLGVYTNSNSVGIKQQKSMSAGLNIAGASTNSLQSFSNPLINSSAVGGPIIRKLATLGIFDGKGGMSYQNYFMSGPNMILLSHIEFTKPFMKYYSTIPSLPSAMHSAWSAGPDHCYLSSGDQLIAGGLFGFIYFGSLSIGTAHIFSSLEFEYLVIEDDVV